MNNRRPSIIVTGASGFIGSYFLDSAKDTYRIYAIARRSQKEAGIKLHDNITWMQIDISNWTSLKVLAHKIMNDGGADYIFHLAGYYDFSMQDNPEYELTNVVGTKNMLLLARMLSIKRFIFSSSLAISNFINIKEKITESTPPDADYPYAVSKRKGEELVKEYSAWVPASIVRFAAVFSDWCQYPPLYVFLSTWLSQRWNARILGGRGESAVSYIYISELISLINTILEKSDSLLNIDTYIASPSGCTSHGELFSRATEYFYGGKIKPLKIPVTLAYPGVYLRNIIGSLKGVPPFEKPWMLKYIDHKLDVDSSYTSKTLGWEPNPRSDISSRLLYMIAKLKTEPDTWIAKNEAALKRIALRPNLLISEEMAISKDIFVREIIGHILGPGNRQIFKTLNKINPGELENEINEIYDVLMSSVQINDRIILFNYICYFCFHHFDSGIEPGEAKQLVSAFNEILVRRLAPKLKHRVTRQDIHDSLTMMLVIVNDEITDIYENVLSRKND